LHKIRVYVDTSVFGGTQDEEFAEASLRFFELVRNGEYIILVSEMTLAELNDAPATVRSVYADLPAACIEELSIGEGVNALA